MDNEVEKIAEALVSLTYGDLMEIAGTLCAIMNDRLAENAQIDDVNEWASLLHGWAEANLPAREA